MARTELTKTVIPGGYSGTGNKITMAAADTTNDNYFKATGRDIIIVTNTDTGSHDFRIESIDDIYGRQEELNFSIPAGETYVFGPFKNMGWKRGSGQFYCYATDTTIEIGVIQL